MKGKKMIFNSKYEFEIESLFLSPKQQTSRSNKSSTFAVILEFS